MVWIVTRTDIHNAIVVTVSIYTAFAGRLDCTEIGDVTHKNSPGRHATGRTRRLSFQLSRCVANTWLHRPHTGSLWSGGFGLCRWLRTGNLTPSGNTSVLWIHFCLSKHISHAHRRTTTFRPIQPLEPDWIAPSRWCHTQEFTGRNSTGRTSRILCRLSRMDPLPGSMDCRQGVCGVVRFDFADGLKRVIQCYTATRPYFEDSFIKSCESCEQKNYRYLFFLKNIRQHLNPEVPTKHYRKERPHDLWRRSYHLRLSPTFPMFGQTNIGARLMAYPNNNVWTRVTNCFSAHERGIFVFISPVAK